MKTREDKRMVKHFLVNDHSSCFTFSLHLVRGMKALQIDFLRNRTMEVGRSSWTMEKGHLSWFDSMVHGVNQSLLDP